MHTPTVGGIRRRVGGGDVNSSSFVVPIVGVVLALGAVASGHSWNGWDVRVYEDRGIGAVARWNIRQLVACLGAGMVVWGADAMSTPNSEAFRWAVLAADWGLFVFAVALSRGRLWEPPKFSGRGSGRAMRDLSGRLRLVDLTRRGRTYVSVVIAGLLVSAAIGVVSFVAGG